MFTYLYKHSCSYVITIICLIFFQPFNTVQAASKYGQTLVKSYNVPNEAIQAFNNFQNSTSSNQNTPPIFDIFNASMWSSDAIKTLPTTNPYTAVAIIRGHAINNGDLSSTWTPSWAEFSEDSAQQAIAPLMQNLAEKDLKAGETVELITLPSPITVTSEKMMTFQLSLTKKSNIHIDSIRVEIWNGVGNPTFFNMLTSTPLLFVIVFLFVGWALKRLF